MIILDSIGNLASRKEVDDALGGKTVADMSRAKQIKSLFRMVTPHLTMKDIPMVVVNHTYKEIGMFPKDIVGGGTGSYYSADSIFILGRQQEKDGTEITGSVGKECFNMFGDQQKLLILTRRRSNDKWIEAKHPYSWMARRYRDTHD